MKIIICGCNGKMGQAVIKAANKSQNCEIVAGIDILKEQNLFPVFDSFDNFNLKADVLIDFSHPSLLPSLLNYCEKTGTPAVICTTGLSDDQIAKIKNTSKNVALFYSRNMSLGINVIIELSKKARKILNDDFDVEIIEKHHNQKIDAPSGTALMIAENIATTMANEPQFTYDRTINRKARGKSEIGIHSIRGGSIPGDHEVIFAGQDEIITISHHAGSRDIFANGAIKAAKFIIGKDAGLYSMQDMLKNI